MPMKKKNLFFLFLFIVKALYLIVWKTFFDYLYSKIYKKNNEDLFGSFFQK